MLVLLVEDEAITAFDLMAEFELRGHVVLGPTREFEGALSLTRAQRPDIALVDINLSGSPVGVQIAATLTHQMDIPVVFLTGQKPEARAHHDAAMGLIAKPVHSGCVVECAEALKSLLDGEEAVLPPDLELFAPVPRPRELATTQDRNFQMDGGGASAEKARSGSLDRHGMR
jgi:two-component system, response regulator PdtaR